MEQLGNAAFWIALGNIILVNIVLSGDNAIVIAMAARSLPPEQQRKAIFFGSAGAIVLRIVLTVFALQLLTLPYLKIVGGLLLFYIGVNLLADDEDPNQEHHHTSLAVAIRTILMADLVMSLDNVLGVAAAAKGNVTLLVAGLMVSIPLIIFGSSLILKIMERVPVIIVGGAGLLGYLAGEMLVSDPALQTWVATAMPWHDWTVPGTGIGFSLPGLAGAVAVVLTGHWLARRRAAPA
ncbi:MAG: TerC family protein [Herminiimonas sp.]|nr:TerC family protein [Herminiimonas sp.]